MRRIAVELVARVTASSRHGWPWFSLAAVIAAVFWMGLSARGLWPAHLLMLGPAWFGGYRGRAWSRLAFVMWLVGPLYFAFPLLAPYRLGPVHVADLYQAELNWFGIGPLTPPEWLALRQHPLLDLAAGLAYILYLYVPPLAFAFLSLSHPERARRLAIAFLLVNCLGLMLYLLYPAAPPWYVARYGLGPARLDTPPDPAGAARFDALVGLPYFARFYARSTNVFGAMPSLHAAYPLLVYLCLPRRCHAVAWAALVFALWVGFAAVYLQHHYVLDVAAGYVCAALAAACATAISRGSERAPRASRIVGG